MAVLSLPSKSPRNFHASQITSKVIGTKNMTCIFYAKYATRNVVCMDPKLRIPAMPVPQDEEMADNIIHRYQRPLGAPRINFIAE
jgi:hypothetical protein